MVGSGAWGAVDGRPRTGANVAPTGARRNRRAGSVPLPAESIGTGTVRSPGHTWFDMYLKGSQHFQPLSDLNETAITCLGAG
jgi:hypothetical protein